MIAYFYSMGMTTPNKLANGLDVRQVAMVTNIHPIIVLQELFIFCGDGRWRDYS